jgi:hypothetical protein
MNPRIIIPLLCVGAIAFACGPRSRSESGSLGAAQTTSPAGKPVQQARPRHATKEARLDARLRVDVQPTRVHFAFDVSNTGGKHVELSFPSGKSYDFVVMDSLGREVWQWSDGRMFTQGVQNKQLGTGDSMKVDGTWRAIPQPGQYTAIATLNSTNYPVKQQVDFVVR